jgi:hypothetical protein
MAQAITTKIIGKRVFDETVSELMTLEGVDPYKDVA